MKKCLECGKEHKRKKFCSNKCKDKFHNRTNPRGYFAHLNINGPDYDLVEAINMEIHPLDPEAFGQE